MRATKLLSTIVLSIVLLSTLLLASSACTNNDVTAALGDAAAGAHSVALTAAAQFGATDPRTKRIENWSETLTRLRSDYSNATTPGAQLALLPALNASISAFESEVLPLFKLNPGATVWIATIDAGLRIAANHFVTAAKTVTPSARATGGARIATDSEGGSNADPTREIEKLKAFLATPKVKAK